MPSALRHARALLAASAFAALSFAAPRADAFCGFYVAPGDKPLVNDATTVALMREGTVTVMSMSNNYKGPAEDFAMVVPVPVVLSKDSVKTLEHEVFKRLEELTAPRLVEYWEKDPCDHPCADAKPGEGCGFGTGSGFGYGSGSGSLGGTVVLASFAVGEYEIVILGAKDSDDLEKWLLSHGYKIPKGAAAALAPYIREQMKFFVAKVDAKKVKRDAQGVVTLSPLRLQYESQEFRLPVRLGLLNAQAKQDLIVYVLSKGSRYEVANYPNAFIPTNLEVRDDVRDAFSPFYASLFDATIEKAGGKAVVTEYAWSSSSCDPCPTPPLQEREIASLGGDVLFPSVGSAGASAGKGGMQRGTRLDITRLHTRYDGKTLTDDLVFRAAEPVSGGREETDAKGGLSKTAKPSSTNSFQARYVIRHAWTGPIACRNPQRGEWGEAPGGGRTPSPGKATGLAGAQRGVSLASYLKEPLPEIAAVSGGPKVSDAGAADAADADALADAGATSDASFGAGTVPSVSPARGRGCGCEVAGGAEGASGGLAALAGLSAVGVIGRRRRGRR